MVLGGTLGLHGALLVVQLAAFALMLGPSMAHPGFPLDDAWIHQVIARTFAETGTLGYEPGRHGSAATSLLWPAILALNPALFHASAVLFTVLVGSIAHLAAGQLVLRMLLADGVGRSSAFLGAALFSVAGNGVWFAVSGMEASLLVALSCAAVHWSFRGGVGWSIAAGAALGALFLTRPEGALLTALIIAAMWVRGERGWRRFVAIMAPGLGAIFLFTALNFINTGLLKPSTLTGRKWMWLQAKEGWSAGEQVLDHLLIWAERLNTYTLGFEHSALLWIAMGCAALGAFEIARVRACRTALLSLWALAHLTTYAVLLPTPGHGGRYQPLIPSVFLMLVGFGLLSLARASCALAASRDTHSELLPWLARRYPLLVGAPMLLQALLVNQVWGYEHALAVRHVNDTEIAMGRSLNRLPVGAKIASFDIGGIGFFSERPLVDLGGLVDPSVVPRLATEGAVELLQERNVEYVVLPLGYSDNFPDPWNFADRLGLTIQRTLRLTPILEHASEPNVWAPGLQATWHSSPRQVLFRVEVNDAP